MSFTDLPADWPTLPLTDPQLVSDVLDLLVSERDRHFGAVFILLCDEHDRLALPTACDDPDPLASREEGERAVRTILQGGSVLGNGSFLVAVARTGDAETHPNDAAWAEAAVAAAAHSPMRLLGVYVVTPHGIGSVPLAGAA